MNNTECDGSLRDECAECHVDLKGKGAYLCEECDDYCCEDCVNTCDTCLGSICLFFQIICRCDENFCGDHSCGCYCPGCYYLGGHKDGDCEECDDCGDYVPASCDHDWHVSAELDS